MPWEINDDIPVPSSEGRSIRYPFGAMQVGQSFLVKLLAGEEAHKRVRAIKNSARAWKFRRRVMWEFHVASVKDGVRCWRVK